MYKYILSSLLVFNIFGEDKKEKTTEKPIENCKVTISEHESIGFGKDYIIHRLDGRAFIYEYDKLSTCELMYIVARYHLIKEHRLKRINGLARVYEKSSEKKDLNKSLVNNLIR